MKELYKPQMDYSRKAQKLRCSQIRFVYNLQYCKLALLLSLFYHHHVSSSPLQRLQPDFRLDYCHLWQALIKGDISKVEHYSRRLGAGDLYPLFACVLTARSWTAVNAGISSVPVTHSEV